MKSSYKLWAGLLFGFATLLVAVLLFMARTDLASHRPEYGLPTFIILGVLLLVSVTVGVSIIIKHEGEAESGLTRSFETYHHLWRLGIILVVGLTAAVLLRSMLVPQSYGAYGFYRGDAVAELANVQAPVFQGQNACAACHEKIAGLHDKDVHSSVQCENCHGPGQEHIAARTAGIKTSGKEIVVPRSKDTCLVCHLKLKARPATFPQIDPDQHFAMLEVKSKETLCMACHNPHEPLFLDTRLAEARLHPLIAQCESCHHDRKVDSNAALPGRHPAVFQCQYCHGALAADFSRRTHGKFDCAICHQFYPESDLAGRIVKHRDPRFCLLCHEKREFVGDSRKPAIAWPDHLNDVSGDPADQKKVCADCHRDAFHHAFPAGAAIQKAQEE